MSIGSPEKRSSEPTPEEPKESSGEEKESQNSSSNEEAQIESFDKTDGVTDQENGGAGHTVRNLRKELEKQDSPALKELDDKGSEESSNNQGSEKGS